MAVFALVVFSAEAWSMACRRMCSFLFSDLDGAFLMDVPSF